jgi:hypothetical protein
MPSRSRKGSTTSSKTTTASENSWTNVRVHLRRSIYHTSNRFCPHRRPVCPSPDALGHHPKCPALLREHDSVRIRHLSSRDGAGHPSRRPRHARNRSTRPEGRGRSRETDQCVSLSARVSPTHAISPTDYQTLRPRIEALLEAHKQDTELASSLEKRTAALIKQYGTHVSHREPRARDDLRVRLTPYRTSRSVHYLSCSSRGTMRFAKLKTRWPSWNATRSNDASWDTNERPPTSQFTDGVSLTLCVRERTPLLRFPSLRGHVPFGLAFLASDSCMTAPISG